MRCSKATQIGAALRWALSAPTRSIFAGCCARAASGHVAAAPPHLPPRGSDPPSYIGLVGLGPLSDAISYGAHQRSEVCNWHITMVRCGAVFRPLLNEATEGAGGGPGGRPLGR